MPSYLFDVKLFAAIRVEADSEAAARELLQQHGECMACNGGAWPNGDPILFEASIDGEAYLIDDEVDDEVDDGDGNAST